MYLNQLSSTHNTRCAWLGTRLVLSVRCPKYLFIIYLIVNSLTYTSSKKEDFGLTSQTGQTIGIGFVPSVRFLCRAIVLRSLLL